MIATSPAGVPLNVTYYGGIGKVTVLWESPAVDPDPTTTKYRLYATPLAAEGRRRLLDEQQTSIAALVPSKGDGSAADPFNATVYLPGESKGQGARRRTALEGLGGMGALHAHHCSLCNRWQCQHAQLRATLLHVCHAAHLTAVPISLLYPCSLPLNPCPSSLRSHLAAGNYSFAASAWNSIGESALSPESARTAVAFSTHPRFWTVQGSPEGALLRVIRPDSVAEPDNLRFKIGILKAGDSGSGVFRAATLEEFSGNGSLADPAVFTIPLSAFGEGTQYAQVRSLGLRGAGLLGGVM